MGKTASKKVFTFRRTTGDLSHDWDYGCRTATLCFYDVRRAFGMVFGEKAIDFHVTDKRPKSMTNWHFLRRNSFNGWRLSSGVQGSTELMSSASELLNRNFPNSKTLYVCAYT